jgi:hypothetical protein
MALDLMAGAGFPSMDPITQSLAQNALMAKPAPAYREPHGIGNFLGRLGDALLVANGREPIYAKRQEQDRMRALGPMIANYLGANDAGLADIVSASPSVGVELYKAKHPASEVPLDVKMYEYRKLLPPDQQAALDKIIAIMHPTSPAPLILGPNDTLEGGSQGGSGYYQGGGDVPTVSSAAEAIKSYPPGTVVKSTDGRRFKVPGGATASTPSPTFR